MLPHRARDGGTPRAGPSASWVWLDGQASSTQTMSPESLRINRPPAPIVAEFPYHRAPASSTGRQLVPPHPPQPPAGTPFTPSTTRLRKAIVNLERAILVSSDDVLAHLMQLTLTWRALDARTIHADGGTSGYDRFRRQESSCHRRDRKST